jgi:hypothetical protein
MGSMPRPQPIGEPQEVHLKDGVEDGTLISFMLYKRNTTIFISDFGSIHYQTDRPPSTDRIEPFIYAEASEHINTTAP